MSTPGLSITDISEMFEVVVFIDIWFGLASITDMSK